MCPWSTSTNLWKWFIDKHRSKNDPFVLTSHKLAKNVPKNDLIYEFESLHKQIKQIVCKIGYQNIALLYVVNEKKSSPKIYQPTDIDIPLLGNEAEIKRNYQSFFKCKDAIELNVVSCRKKLLDESRKCYMAMINRKYGYK